MTNLSNKLKVAVCGSKGVGKSGKFNNSLSQYKKNVRKTIKIYISTSAVTVRYLTKRFIYEYSSLKGNNFQFHFIAHNSDFCCTFF